MGNRKVIVSFGLLFSAIFALFYYVLFTTVSEQGTKEESRTLYVNQVGIYAEEDNAEKVYEKLKQEGFTPYRVNRDEKQIIMTSVSTKEDTTKEEGEKLQELEYSYITKKITVEGAKLAKAVDEKDYQKVLQAMEDENS